MDIIPGEKVRGENYPGKKYRCYTPINSLKCADDLVIMSVSRCSLQKCLDQLVFYCEKWKLQVNFKRTKIMTFNKQGSFTFSNSRSAEKGTSNLINQAQKAWFSIRYCLLSSNQKNINTYLTLFDTHIKPILLYACDA